MPWLSLGSHARELRDGDVVVGSGPDAGWRIATADLMPRHFVVSAKGGVVSVRPFNNDSVVAVNGRQVASSPSPLSDGDVVAAGAGRFVYTVHVLRSATSPTEREQTAYLIDDRWKVAHPLVNRSTGIGRDASNTVVIRDPTASRFHAEVRREAGGFALHSRGSSGTLINQRPVGSPHLLAEGDTIEIAYSALRFTLQPPDQETLAPASAGVNDDVARRSTMARERISLSTDVVKLPPSIAVPLIAGVIAVVALAVWVWLRSRP